MEKEIEIWKEIVGYNGIYSISNTGSVKRNPVPVTRTSRRGNEYKSVFKGTAIKQFLNRDGYHYVGLCVNGKPKQHKVHRLVANHFCEKIDGKSHVDHIDGNKLNNDFRNLRWCTHAENIRFAWDIGIYNNIGSNHGMAKLNENHVKEIKKLIASGERNYVIARQFGIKQSTICDIKKGRTWSHV